MSEQESARDLELEVRELTRAWSIRPAPKVRVALAEASRALVRDLLARGQLGAAVPHQQRVVALDVDDESAAAELVRLLWLTGDVAGAASGMARLARAAPKDVGRRRALAVLRLAQGLAGVALEKLAGARRGAVESCGPGWCVALLERLAEGVRDDLSADRLLELVRARRPRGVPTTLDALLGTLESLLARDARAALDRALVANPPLPAAVEEGLVELAVIALLRGRDSRGQRSLEAADATRLELLAAEPGRVPERVRNAVARALIDAGRAAGALDLIAVAPAGPEARAHRAAALAALGRSVEARVERTAALADVLAGPAGPVPGWLPGVLAPLAGAHAAPDALQALLARVRARFPAATLGERINTVAELGGAKGPEVLDQVLKYLRAGPRPDPLAIAAAAALGGKASAALEILERLPEGMRSGREGDIDSVHELALRRWFAERAPERARPHVERREGALWALQLAVLEERRLPGAGRARAEVLLGRAAGDPIGCLESAEALHALGDGPLAVRFLRQLEGLSFPHPREAARAVACALAVGASALAARLLGACLKDQEDDDARQSVLILVLTLVLEREDARVVPQCELLATQVRSLAPRGQALSKAVADLAVSGWGRDRSQRETASRAQDTLRAHAARFGDRRTELERRWIGEVLRGVVEGSETAKDPALAPRRPATANRVVRQALIAYVAAHLPALAVARRAAESHDFEPKAPVTSRRRRRARTG